MVLKANFACSQRPLQEQSQRQLSELGFNKCTDGLVSEGEDLLALLFPLVILTEGKCVLETNPTMWTNKVKKERDAATHQ